MGRRVLLVTGTFKKGGAEKRTVEIANHFFLEGQESALACMDSEGSLNSGLLPGVKLFDLTLRGVKLFGLIPIVKLFYIVIKYRYDTVFSNLFGVNKYVLLATYFLRVKTYIGVFTHPQRHKAHRGSFLYARADAIVLNSKGANKVFPKYFPQIAHRTEVIYNGISLSSVEAKLKDKFNIRGLIGEREPVIIASINSLRVEKGLKVLIESVNELKKTKDVFCVIAGDGPQKEDLERLVKEKNLETNIHFAGILENPFSLLSVSGVFILSSYYEGMPNVILEAMASKVPVIATRALFGPEEIITARWDGVLVAPGDFKAIAREALYLSENSEFRSHIIRNAIDTVSIKFSARGMLSHYQELLCNN